VPGEGGQRFDFDDDVAVAEEIRLESAEQARLVDDGEVGFNLVRDVA
jgi:hypothetical protein